MRSTDVNAKVLSIQFFSKKKGNSRKNCAVEPECRQNQKKQYLEILCSMTTMVFTGTLFLGGSYLFFIQLAEYGW